MTESKLDRVVHSEKPFNAEPALMRLRAHIVTDTSDFYVRSHGDVPEVEAARYRLRISGKVRTPLELSLEIFARASTSTASKP